MRTTAPTSTHRAQRPGSDRASPSSIESVSLVNNKGACTPPASPRAIDTTHAVRSHLGKFPPPRLDTTRLPPALLEATAARARHDQMRRGMHNSDVFLAPPAWPGGGDFLAEGGHHQHAGRDPPAPGRRQRRRRRRRREGPVRVPGRCDPAVFIQASPACHDARRPCWLTASDLASFATSIHTAMGATLSFATAPSPARIAGGTGTLSSGQVPGLAQPFGTLGVGTRRLRSRTTSTGASQRFPSDWPCPRKTYSIADDEITEMEHER